MPRFGHPARPLVAPALSGLALLVAGCATHSPVEPEPSPDVVVRVWPEGITKVDLLFVFADNSSMGEELFLVADQGVVILRTLTAEATAPVDLHVGVATADMGTGGWAYPSVPSCADDYDFDVGDHGVLQNEGRYEGCLPIYTAADCGRDECPWLSASIEPPEERPRNSEELSCLVPGLCGTFTPQLLEASLVALTEESAPGRPNEGFLRDDSILAIVYFTDEDDASVADPGYWDPDREDLGPLWLRRFAREDLMFPIERYVDGLRALRPEGASRLLVDVIAGVPIDGRWEPGDPLDLLRELKGVDGTGDLLTTCETAVGIATSPARLVDLAYRLGDDALIGSICRSDLTENLQSLAAGIHARLGGSCLPAEAPSDPPSHCRVVATLPAESACFGSPESDLGLGDDGRRRCRVPPSTPTEPGWSFLSRQADDPEADRCEHGQLRFQGVELGDDAEVYLECWDDE